MVKGQKTIRIACLGTPVDYSTSLVPLAIKSLGYNIKWSRPIQADLLIYGSFYDVHSPRLRWLPKAWRARVGLWVDYVQKELSKRRLPPVTMFHTAENLRHDHIKADYSISHDLNVQSDRHFRLPYWMEMIDWSHEGLCGNQNPRYGELLKIELLQTPLGDQFLRRSQKAVLITSHLRKPKNICLATLQEVMPVDGLGPYFNKSIKHHNRSNFFKRDILQKYAFNLCPENGIYSGYVTEKIPEAFASGCLPITFVDDSVKVDFNPKSFVNLALMTENNFAEFKNIFQSKLKIASYADEPLMLEQPSTYSLKSFIHEVLMSS